MHPKQKHLPAAVWLSGWLPGVRPAPPLGLGYQSVTFGRVWKTCACVVVPHAWEEREQRAPGDEAWRVSPPTRIPPPGHCPWS